MNGMFQGEGSLASSQQGSSGIMSKPAKEEAKPEKEEAKPEKTPVSFNFQGEGGEDNNSDNTDSGTVVTNKEVDDVIAEYKLPTVLTSYNNTVKDLQTYLNATPVAPSLSTDGRWGAKTSAAVSDFQRYKDELYKRATTAAETFNETGGIASRTTTKPAFERFQVADSGAGFGALSDAASLDGYKPSFTDMLRKSLQTTQQTILETNNQPRTDAQNRAAQEYLGITVDGNWGKGSTRTLASWQYKNGLLVSGKLDEETLSAMKNPNTLDPRKEFTRKSVLNEAGTAPDLAKVKAWAKENLSDPIRAAAFVATVEAETGGRALVEGGYRLNRAIEVFVTNNKYMHIDDDLKKPLDGRGLRRKASLEALGTSASGDQIFNYIYGPDADAIGSILGNTTATDGSTYKGRGLIQITGKDNYKRVGKILGIDLVSNPELVNDPKYAAPAAMAYLSLPGKDFFSGTMSRDYLKGVVGHSGGTTEAQDRWDRAEELEDEMYP